MFAHSSVRLLPSVAVFALMLASSLPSARAANGDCGIPIGSGSAPKTSDCLAILRAGVGLFQCAPCTCDTTGDGKITAGDALRCLRIAVGQNLGLLCPACNASGSCPGSVEWTTTAGYGNTCTTNADCDSGTCDPSSGRCRTRSVLDVGWSGLGHHGDTGDGETLSATLQCAASQAPCGDCDIAGLQPAARSCRCQNDSRKACDEPFQLDAADCPACEAGAYVGFTCANNGDCDAGTCSRRCSNNLSTVCSNNGQCPGGSCDAAAECDNGKSCFVDADCTGTCTTSSRCVCYDGPPFALALPGAPACIVRHLDADLSGTVNVDNGATDLVEPVHLLTYLGISTTSPCPICGGRCSNSSETQCAFDLDCPAGGHCATDAVAGDGVRGGTCLGGLNDGLPCDVDGVSHSFPVGIDGDAGGGLSLDCMPEPGRLVSGSGRTLSIRFETSGSSLPAALSCGGSNADRNCPCLVCSSDRTVPCAGNSDCASQTAVCSLSSQTACSSDGDCSGVNAGPCIGAVKRCQKATTIVCANDNDCASANVGTCTPSSCSVFGTGVAAAPNACDDGVCTGIGGDEARCASGPDDTYCDGVVTAGGDGIVPCSTNSECIGGSIPIDGGTTCSLVQRRRCFLDPVVAAGDADRARPVLAAALCMPPTVNAGINALAGLPGPARWIRQTSSQLRCATAPAVFYHSGTGGCP